MSKPRASRTLCAVLTLLASGCGSEPLNEQGNLRALERGAMLMPTALRQAPDAELSELCGSGAATEAGALSLVRRPFLQQLSTNEVTVAFQTAQLGRYDVQLTTPWGKKLQTLTSQPRSEGQQVVRLGGLEPATTYCYSVRGLSHPAGFRTPPAAGSDANVRFVAFGDSGSGNRDQLALRDQLETVPLDLMLHTGDLAYDFGTTAQLDRTVFSVYQRLLHSFPFYPVAGNHDYEWQSGAAFFDAFVLPENGDPGLPERYYSFDWADVHFVALDTEQIGREQAAWLDADLSRNQRAWTVVYGHRPPFSSGDHGGSAAFRQHFVPVLERHQVPLVLSGHDHDYERTRVLNGVTYVVTGGGGVGTKPVGHDEFTAFSQAVIHFVHVDIHGSRLELRAIDGTGQEFDQVLIER